MGMDGRQASTPDAEGGMSRLRAERERLGLTQGQIEALLWGMPHRTYQDIEAERRVPPPWVMAAVFERLAKRSAKPTAK
jgi:hypothetical protein